MVLHKVEKSNAGVVKRAGLVCEFVYILLVMLYKPLFRVAYLYLGYLLVFWPEIVIRSAKLLLEMGEQGIRGQPALVFVDESVQFGVVITEPGLLLVLIDLV